MIQLLEFHPGLRSGTQRKQQPSYFLQSNKQPDGKLNFPDYNLGFDTLRMISFDVKKNKIK
jgi:hypothetical protein